MNKSSTLDQIPEKMTLRRQLIRLVLLAGFTYLGFCLMLAFLQRKLIYVPRAAPVLLAESGYPEERIREIVLSVDDGLNLYGWYCLPDTGKAPASPRLALIFPGNGGNRLNRVRILELVNDLGCAALIVDYRGYGGSHGAPSEEAIATDCRKVWGFATGELGFSNDQIIVFGQSLGGGVATRLVWELCQENQAPAGLVLQATFTSLVDAAQHRFPWLPVNLLLVDRYPSINRIPDITCPLLMLHGRQDEIVPLQLGERLFAVAPEVSANGIQKRFVELPDAGHNDIYHVALDDVIKAKREFLDSIQDASRGTD
ncbi:alpha/beta hydrolase [Thalassoglobus polymorphus]|uniref:Alpha/beta hydrolase family protein n=1 Tax=Thalassoglobus polymorphus TaxID=2527994 RepID=A0A517QI38_9PLAN|nr:alpha/beta hydrolase [Thalassoglobus polymorphus]QDT31301.1 Alpha/beta hydrolase family protein [Thalassoglobus polymorphus]